MPSGQIRGSRTLRSCDSRRGSIRARRPGDITSRAPSTGRSVGGVPPSAHPSPSSHPWLASRSTSSSLTAAAAPPMGHPAAGRRIVEAQGAQQRDLQHPPDGQDVVQTCEVIGGSHGALPLPAQAPEPSGLGCYRRSSAARLTSPRSTRSQSRMTRRRGAGRRMSSGRPTSSGTSRSRLPGPGERRQRAVLVGRAASHRRATAGWPRAAALRRWRSMPGAGPRPAISPRP